VRAADAAVGCVRPAVVAARTLSTSEDDGRDPAAGFGLLLMLDAPSTVPVLAAAGCLVRAAALSTGSEELPLPLPPELSLHGCDALPLRASGLPGRCTGSVEVPFRLMPELSSRCAAVLLYCCGCDELLPFAGLSSARAFGLPVAVARAVLMPTVAPGVTGSAAAARPSSASSARSLRLVVISEARAAMPDLAPAPLLSSLLSKQRGEGKTGCAFEGRMHDIFWTSPKKAPCAQKGRSKPSGGEGDQLTPALVGPFGSLPNVRASLTIAHLRRLSGP
jgi:hypothetical protein